MSSHPEDAVKSMKEWLVNLTSCQPRTRTTLESLNSNVLKEFIEESSRLLKQMHLMSPFLVLCCRGSHFSKSYDIDADGKLPRPRTGIGPGAGNA